MWALKYISENQSAQRQLRTSLRNAFPAATAERRQPTAEEITEARISYLDAFMEELFRMAATIPAHVRTTTEDTTILGHFVPKGTEIFLAINGPGFSSPAFAVDETTRSETSRSMKDASRSWDLTDMDLFRPERWLVTDAQGHELVDLTAAPQMLFSLGPRACFGRKLGYLNIRVLLVLLVWHFEFLELPKELISDDGIERFTRQPRLTYVRIGESRW
jgi:cytochrome P450